MLGLIYVIMLVSQRGSPDGISVNTYEQGERYNLPEGLANSFIDSEVAEKVSDSDFGSDEGVGEDVGEDVFAADVVDPSEG